MKPLGQRPVKFPSKTDHRIKPKKKWKNWWEELSTGNKQRWRRKMKQALRDWEEEIMTASELFAKQDKYITDNWKLVTD